MGKESSDGIGKRQARIRESLKRREQLLFSPAKTSVTACAELQVFARDDVDMLHKIIDGGSLQEQQWFWV